MRNDCLTEYTGAPRQQKQRGFVTVREPALGFFIAGTSIEKMNGIYVCCRNEILEHKTPQHNVLLAYRNDGAPHWFMALVEPKDAELQRRAAKRNRTRRHMYNYSDSEDDSEDDDPTSLREWVIIDPTGKDRFRHQGDTIIPGAGVSWKHLHRPRAGETHVSEDEDAVSAEEEEDYDSADSDGEIIKKKQAEAAARGAVEVKGPKEEDEDELPWQVIAILDRETVGDMRYTQRCYDANIDQAKQGRNLPKPAITGLETHNLAGTWLFKVAGQGGVEVRAAPDPDAPVIAWKESGTFVQVIERKEVGSVMWVRLPKEKGDNRFRDEYYDDEHMDDNFRHFINEYGGGYNPNRRMVGGSVERWVRVGDEEAGEELRLEEIIDGDLPDFSTKLPEESESAALFDKPFEAMIEDKAPEEVEADEEYDNMKKETAEEHVNEIMDQIREENKKNKRKDVVVSLPIISEEDLIDQIKIDTPVGLEALNKAEFNGRTGKIVQLLNEEGRFGIQMNPGNQKISIKPANIRLVAENEDGPLGRWSRVLSINLHMLGLVEEGYKWFKDGESGAVDDTSTAASAEGSPKDNENSSSCASTGDETKEESKKEESEIEEISLEAKALDAKEEKSPSQPKKIISAEMPQVSHLLAGEILGTALRATQRDLAPDAKASQQDALMAHDKLLEAVVKQKPADVGEDPVVTTKPPLEVLASGALGSRAALAALVIDHSKSIDQLQKEAIPALKELLIDEQARRHRVDFADQDVTLEELTSEDSIISFDEGNDALRLRLTLVTGLLKARQETEAIAEAAVAYRLHPDCSSTQYYHGRCLLRQGKRGEAIAMLTKASTHNRGADGAWAMVEANTKMRYIKLMRHAERKAKDSYQRGLFEDAINFYNEAATYADLVKDDKWSRAEIYSNRCVCNRRVRNMEQALKDVKIAVDLFPYYKRAIFRRGVCQLEVDKPAEAIQTFETLMSIDREWPNLLEWMVRAYANQRRSAGISFDYGAYAHQQQYNLPEGGWAQAAGEKDIADEPNHYTVLGVSQDVTEKQLKRAYRAMSLKYHPDKEGGSTRAFQRIALANQVLSDPVKRQQYDEGADLKEKPKDEDEDSDDDEKKKQSLREEIERKYYPERYKFWPFGDPFIEKRRRAERARQRAGRPAWHEEDI